MLTQPAVPLGGVGSGGHVDRQAGQVHPRRRPLPGRASRMQIDLSTPSAMNVINCKSPDGTMTLSACDSEVLQSDARMTNQPCKTCHSQMDPYARVAAELRPDRQLPHQGRAVATPSTRPSRSCRLRRSRPAWPPAPSSSRKTLAQSGVLRGCSVQKIASYAIGEHDPDVQHLRDQRPAGADERHDHLAVQDAWPWPIPARAHGRYEVSVLQVQTGDRSCGRAAGRPRCSRRCCGPSRRARRG